MLALKLRPPILGGLSFCFWLTLPALADDRWAMGREVFTAQSEPACGLCHTLREAGTTGQIGPNLDELKPTAARVMTAVRGGVGIMPAFGESLTEEQIDAVAYYVEKASGGVEKASGDVEKASGGSMKNAGQASHADSN